MTLTQQDLTAIGEIVDQKLKQGLKKELNPIKKDISSLKRDVKDIKATQNLIIGQFDLRLNTLEKHTTHPPKTTSFLVP